MEKGKGDWKTSGYKLPICVYAKKNNKDAF